MISSILARAALTAAVMLAAPLTAGAAIDVSHVAQTRTKSDLAAGWSNSAAFMEIFVRSYKDSDGDGVGDFKGLTSQLDYLKSLGVTGIWLMPIMPSADHDHGYAVADYRAVDPQYGSMADFETFLAEAHKRGIGVILDLVVNHSANTNPLFLDAEASKSSPYRDWYIFTDKQIKWPGFKVGPYRKVQNGAGWYYGVFDDRMPDFNLRNPKTVAYMEDTMRFWMNKGVDGFRLDAVTMLLEDGPKSFFNNPGNPAIVARYKAVVDSYENSYMVCEVSEKQEMYTKQCGHAFAYNTQAAIIDSARKGAIAPGIIAQLQSSDRDRMPLALQSHDSYVGDRLINQFGVNDIADYKVAAAIAILAARTTFSYYGEEIGMSNGGRFDDPGLRSPMSWTAQATTAGFSTAKPYRAPAINYASMNVAAEAGDPASLLAWYTALYNVRRAHPVIGTGNFTLLSKAGDPVLAFRRVGKDDTAVVAINVSDAPQSVTLDTGMAGAAFVDALGDTKPVADGAGKVTLTVAPKAASMLTPVRPR